jgi:hypothetical protein
MYFPVNVNTRSHVSCQSLVLGGAKSCTYSSASPTNQLHRVRRTPEVMLSVLPALPTFPGHSRSPCALALDMVLGGSIGVFLVYPDPWYVYLLFNPVLNGYAQRARHVSIPSAGYTPTIFHTFVYLLWISNSIAESECGTIQRRFILYF